MVTRIAVVLPLREHFTLRKSGAVALSARDFALQSRFREGVTVLGAGICEYADVPYRRVDLRPSWWRRERTSYALAVAQSVRRVGYEAIEIQNRPYLVKRLRAWLPERRLALHLHNDPQTMDGSRSVRERRLLLARLDAVYCVSAFVRGQFLDGIDDDEGKTVVVYNGVARNAPTAPREKIVAYTGRVIEIKGVAQLAEAFMRAAPDMPGWRLVIAGEDKQGLLARWRGEPRIETLGQVSHAEAMALYARAEIAAVPSLWQEPFGRAAAEALASGCAVIGTEQGGLAEVLSGAAEIVDARDIAGFAQRLVRVASDEALRRDLQARAVARSARFDIRETTKALDEARARLLRIAG